MKQFSQDRSGNFSLMAAILMLPLILAAGLAVDFSRLVNAKYHAQGAVDAAALAAANNPHMTDEELSTLARQYLVGNMSGEGEYKQSDISVRRNGTGTVDVSFNAVLNPFFMQVADYPKLAFGVSAAATLGGASAENTGCVFLTDPRNTGLNMTDSSKFITNCVIMITTRGTAIKTGSSARAEFSGICANGSISASPGTLTPSEKLDSCSVVVDPFGGMSPPRELASSCISSGSSTGSGQVKSLSAGVHCGMVTVSNNGTLNLKPGIHYFKAGLDLQGGGTLQGEDVLIALDKSVSTYTLSGKLNVTGLQSGSYKGFVIYHQDFSGSSNSIVVGPAADFRADGVIYLPNTNMKISTAVNELATQSILVADRFELQGNASFHAKIDTRSKTPLPDLIGGEGNLRLSN
ncbi:putative Flp pilus-assembly TadE/G-like protein [Hoeflea halophila]|uniref:Putative Flp pilus-assembly TadE/G-like protein n=1 Tax=Hoeflea halophila TaxID=714899 RepID=A0A286HLE6_9HYPH|nr:pilus assembly protein TadG-related protein [Hoeflea halophila]SOE08608.1 putative Flp pilus-assembly TadE/G-like protein [Hoeflea halophila]